MRISRIEIHDFRAIASAELELDEFVALSGPNSSGKTAVLDAVAIALTELPDLSVAEAGRHLDARRLRNRGRTPPARVTLWFEDASPALQQSLGSDGAGFALRTSLSDRGVLTRSLNGRPINHEAFMALRQAIDLVAIPASRDINASTLEPLKTMIRSALQRQRGSRSTNHLRDELLVRVASEANNYLGAYRSVANPGSERGLSLAATFTASLVDEALASMSLRADVGGYDVPLDALGSGHRSEFVLQLLLDRTGKTSEMTLLLIDEPENHLHPQMAERVAGVLIRPQPGVQTLCTTHSPVFMDAVGLENVATVAMSGGKTTVTAPRTSVLAKKAKWGLTVIGLRASDAILATSVVLVEGPSDEVVLRQLQELRGRGDYAQRGVRILPCQGSANVLEAARVLNELKVPWRALLDWDAGFAGGPPMLRADHDRDALSEDVAALRSHVDPASAGSGKLLRTLGRLLDESAGKAQLRGPSKEAPAGKLLRLSGAGPREEERLLAALAAGKPRVANQILNPYGVFLLQSDLESALLRATGSAPVVASVLGVRASTPIAELGPQLKKSEHERKLPEVIEALWMLDLLTRNELKRAADFLFA